MVEFAYNNAKNINTSHILIELNCNYYLYVSFEDNIDCYSISYFIDKLAKKLRDWISICWQNLFYTYKLLKQTHNKE